MTKEFYIWFVRNGGDVSRFYGSVIENKPEVRRKKNINLKQYNHVFTKST